MTEPLRERGYRGTGETACLVLVEKGRVIRHLGCKNMASFLPASIENPDEIPPLEPILPAPARHHNHPPSWLVIAGEEALKYHIGSTLTQIGLALCFRNGREPLFEILSPILYTMDDL
jgi:hypothetical protein